MARFLLAAAVGIMVLTIPTGAGISLGPVVRDGVLGLAAVAAITSVVQVVRPPRRTEPLATVIGVMAADVALALVGAVLFDPTATPLAWVALLVPVLDAAMAFGTAAAAAAWLLVGLLYMLLRLRVSSGSGEAELVRRGGAATGRGGRPGRAGGLPGGAPARRPRPHPRHPAGRARPRG